MLPRIIDKYADLDRDLKKTIKKKDRYAGHLKSAIAWMRAAGATNETIVAAGVATVEMMEAEQAEAAAETAEGDADFWAGGEAAATAADATA